MARRFLSLLAVSCALRSRSTFLLDNAMTVRMTSILTTRKKLLHSLWPTRVGESLVARVRDHDARARAQLSPDSGFVVSSLIS